MVLKESSHACCGYQASGCGRRIPFWARDGLRAAPELAHAVDDRQDDGSIDLHSWTKSNEFRHDESPLSSRDEHGLSRNIRAPGALNRADTDRSI
jgi:hypothetical protein